MADKINFNPDTYEGEIPEYAKEATQEKILAALSKQFNMDQKQLDQAKKQFAADKTHAENLGDDLDKLTGAQRLLADRLHENSRKSGGSLMGKLGNPLVMFTKAVVTAGAGVIALGAGAAFAVGKLTYSAAEFSFSLGRDLQKINDTSILFQGDMANSLSRLNRLGLSTDDAIAAMGNYSMLTTQLGVKNLPGLITGFNRLTQDGLKFGRNMSQNAELLMDQADAQIRLGLFANMDEERRAKSVDAIVTAQLNASKVLGKSMQQIRQETTSSLETSLAAQRILNQFTDGRMRDALSTFPTSLGGMELGESIKQSLLASLGGFGIADTPEAGNTLAFLNTMGQEGFKAVTALEAFKEAQALGDEEKMAESLGKFQESLQGVFSKKATQAQIDTLYSMANAGNETAAQYLKLNRQIRAGITANADNQDKLSAIVKAAANYDNIVLGISGLYEGLQTQFRGAIALTLGPLLKSLGTVSDENTALGKITVSTGKAFESIFGAITKLLTPLGKSAQEFDFLETFAGDAGKSIEKMGGYIAEWIEGLDLEKPGDLMGTITAVIEDGVSYAMTKLGNALADSMRNIDLLGLIFGDSDQELVDQAKSRVEKFSGNSNEHLSPEENTRLSHALKGAISDIVEVSAERGYSTEKMLKLIQDSGVDITKMTGNHLLELFPEAQELKSAMGSVYGDKAQDAWVVASKKIMDAAGEQANDIRTGIGSYLKKDVLIERQAGIPEAIKKAFRDALLTEIIVTAEKKPPTQKNTQDNIAEKKPETAPIIKIPDNLIDAPINRRRASNYDSYRSNSAQLAATKAPEVTKVTPPINPVTNTLNSASSTNVNDSSGGVDNSNKQTKRSDEQNKEKPYAGQEKTLGDVIEAQNNMANKLSTDLVNLAKAVNSSGRKIEQAAS